MTPFEVQNVTRQVAHQVSNGKTVAVREPVRLSARELLIEFQPEPYPEVAEAFSEFCRITNADGSLVRYRVDRDTEASAARVTATVAVGSSTMTASGVGGDVVAASVDAFASAMRGSV